MRTIGNVLWFVLVGWWLGLAYAVAGLLACVLIITIPFGIAAFRLAGYSVWPFGRHVVIRQNAGIASLIGNVIWIVLFGWELALLHLFAGVLLIITIIGIPFGIASIKLSVLALVPLGTRVVDSDGEWTTPRYGREPAYQQ
ncbi:hypothetical protein BJF78_09500 [Pseudonocardia sp. CNS-139]|nr:hypothetical protein BJF78_09500 [Pseudonocardia sp. CNS-139]